MKKFIQNKSILKSIPILLFTSAIILAGCSKEDKIIKEDTFVLVYTDLVIAQDSLSADSSGFVKEKQKIFSKYNVNKKLYLKTLEYYKENPEEWKKLFDKIIIYLRKKENQPI